MNAMNQIIRTGLGATLGALHHLHDAGCTVVGVSVGNGLPVFVILPPPAGFAVGDAWPRTVTTLGGERYEMHSVTAWGCRIEWLAAGERTVLERRHVH